MFPFVLGNCSALVLSVKSEMLVEISTMVKSLGHPISHATVDLLRIQAEDFRGGNAAIPGFFRRRQFNVPGCNCVFIRLLVVEAYEQFFCSAINPIYTFGRLSCANRKLV